MAEEYMERSRKKATTLQHFQVFTKLQEVLEVLSEDLPADNFDRYKGSDGFVKFKDEWSDTAVAEEVGVPQSTVRRARLEHFGPLPGPASGEGFGGGAKYAALLKRVERIEAHLGIVNEEKEEEEDES